MTTLLDQPPARLEPMPARSRYGLATSASLGFHLLLIVLIGLFSLRSPARPEVLIPVELTMSGRAGDRVELGGGGHPEAKPKETKAPSTVEQPTKAQPSSKGGVVKAAPAPPKILTSKKGAEPAGPVAAGKEAAGPGGREEKPAGPTKGPGVVGGTPPIYPKDALDRGFEGAVSLTVTVAPDGSVKEVTVAKTSGHDVLDQAAIRAIKRDWKFQPGLKDGQPAPGAATVTFTFTSGKVETP